MCMTGGLVPSFYVMGVATSTYFVNKTGGLTSGDETNESAATFDTKSGFSFGPGEGIGEARGAFPVGLGEKTVARDA